MARELTEFQRANLVLLIQALRSGEYKQAQAGLCIEYQEETMYCCLGVGGKVLGLSDVELHTQKAEGARYSSGSYLNPEHEVKFGWDWATQKKLAELNDDGNWKFPAIADVVEQWMEGAEIPYPRAPEPDDGY